MKKAKTKKQQKIKSVTPDWECEFGPAYQVPAEILKAGLQDCSWHNDVCPRFQWPMDDNGRLCLWSDHPVPREREYGPKSKRFWVTLDEDCLIETNSLKAALAVMAKNRNKVSRFVMNMGGVAPEQFPDLPEQPADGSIVIWDRQERKPVVTLHAGYAQIICLETNRIGDSPFSSLEKWLNGIDNECLESEGIPVTK